MSPEGPAAERRAGLSELEGRLLHTFSDIRILQTALQAWARVVESVSLKREVDQKVLDMERAAQKKSADMFKRTVAGKDTNE